MPVVLTLIARVDDWHAIQRRHHDVLAERARQAGGTSLRVYRNIKATSQVLLVGTFPDDAAAQEMIREVGEHLGALLVGSVWDDRVWEEIAWQEKAEQQEGSMAADHGKQVVRRWMEVLSTGDMDAADRLLVPQFVAHVGGLPGPIQGPEAWKQLFSVYLTAFPDLRVTVEDLIAEGETVACRFTWRATHRGAFMELAATGREVTGSGIGLFHVIGDKITEEWIQEDTLGLMQQLGLIPAPAGA